MRAFAIGFILFACSSQVFAQEDMHKDFDAFRKQLHSDYKDFRKKVIDDYADFLDGIWRDYDVFRGVDRNPLPKPRRKPVAEHSGLPEKPVTQQPKPVVPQASPSPVPTNPVNTTPVSPTPSPQPTPEIPKPAIPRPDKRIITVNFYGMQVRLPEIAVAGIENIGTNDFGSAWRKLKQTDGSDEIVEEIRRTAAIMRLNDWFTIELARAYADKVLGKATPSARMLLSHYLLTHLGYDIRLGRTNRQPLLLIPCKQQIYARSFVKFNGTNLYIWQDNLAPVNEGQMSIQTCDLPKDADTGMPLDLLIARPLNIPANPKKFSVSHRGMTLTGEVNATLMEMVRHYPQMPVPYYASSCLDSRLRESLVSQVKDQLKGLNQIESVNKLLQFIQFGFEYATDDELHGYEKPYFVEELFYYPKCDCEDRSVLYATLLRQALGVENVLVHYPGHECVAVSLNTPINGDGFKFEGRNYYISDPTYIGAITGQCMPDYQHTSPDVEKW